MQQSKIDTNPNYPSKTGKPSGPGRGNVPKKSVWIVSALLIFSVITVNTDAQAFGYYAKMLKKRKAKEKAEEETKAKKESNTLLRHAPYVIVPGILGHEAAKRRMEESENSDAGTEDSKSEECKNNPYKWHC